MSGNPSEDDHVLRGGREFGTSRGEAAIDGIVISTKILVDLVDCWVD
jgi:hypothetical protein